MSLSTVALITLVQAKAHLRVDAAASLHVDAEYVGIGDDLVVEFSLANNPVEGSLKLYVVGRDPILQVEGALKDYTIDGATITFAVAPENTKQITASYDYAADADTFESYDDELLENLIEAATKKAEDYTGRAFVQRSITEQHSGNSTKILKLYRQPTVTITSVRRHHYEQVGTGDAETLEFTLDNTPITGSVILYVDGVLQVITDDYAIDGATITFVAAPADGTIVTANYNIAVVADYTERLHIGRLYRELTWIQDYIYEVVYTAGYGATRAATQALVPDVVAAVLMMVAYLYENRVDLVKSEAVAGIGSIAYDIPSKAKELLNPYRTQLI